MRQKAPIPSALPPPPRKAYSSTLSPPPIPQHCHLRGKSLFNFLQIWLTSVFGHCKQGIAWNLAINRLEQLFLMIQLTNCSPLAHCWSVIFALPSIQGPWEYPDRFRIFRPQPSVSAGRFESDLVPKEILYLPNVVLLILTGINKPWSGLLQQK